MRRTIFFYLAMITFITAGFITAVQINDSKRRNSRHDFEEIWGKRSMPFNRSSQYGVMPNIR